MKLNFKENCKSIAKSCVNNVVLIERRKNSFLIPLIIFILCVFMMSVPSFLYNNSMTSTKVLNQFPKIEEPLTTVLTSSWDCEVVDQSLVCSEEQEAISLVIGDNVKYTIIANQKTISQDTTVSTEIPKDTDNLIMFLDNYIRIRYIERDYINNSIQKNEIIGDYSTLEGFSFKEIAQKIDENPEILSNEINSFINKVHKSTLDARLLSDIINALISFALLVIVTSFMLKSPTLFRRKKGFKFSECLKISLTSAIPAFLFGILSFLLLGIDFAVAMGFVYLIRIVFIYIKYFFSNKNNFYTKLYESTGEERFKLR